MKREIVLLVAFSVKGRFVIGKNNNPQPVATNYNTALAESKEKSPQEEALGKAAVKTLNWADKGDFRNPREGGLFVNYADPAMIHRNRELQSNAGGQGIYGLGIADPNYLAAVKSNQAAENEMMDAAQYESDVKEGVGQAAGYAGDTGKMDLTRRMNILGTTAGLYGQQLSKPKWWETLLGAAGPIGAAAVTKV